MRFSGNVLTGVYGRRAGQDDRIIEGGISGARLTETAFYGCEGISIGDSSL